MKVHNFAYNGLFGRLTGGDAKYTAEFISWAEDPGVAICKCSDGQERTIPTFALDGFNCEAYPKQDYGKWMNRNMGYKRSREEKRR